MAQVIELFPKATHSPNALDVQRCVEKFLMTRGCPFHRGQKTRLFQEPEKLNMKSTFLGNICITSYSDFENRVTLPVAVQKSMVLVK